MVVQEKVRVCFPVSGSVTIYMALNWETCDKSNKLYHLTPSSGLLSNDYNRTRREIQYQGTTTVIVWLRCGLLLGFTFIHKSQDKSVWTNPEQTKQNTWNWYLRLVDIVTQKDKHSRVWWHIFTLFLFLCRFHEPISFGNVYNKWIFNWWSPYSFPFEAWIKRS